MELMGQQIFLRPLTTADVSARYVNWMNDPEINRYLESRYSHQTEADVINFVKSVDGKKSILFGIFDAKNQGHVGNIKIGNINPHHNYADVGLLIGEKTHWGKGLATEAIALITQYAFKTLRLNKLFAGMYETNMGSYNAFIKNGYREVGRMKKHVLSDGKYLDNIVVEMWAEDFKPNGKA